MIYDFHEIEHIFLVGSRRPSRKDLHQFLKTIEFISIDDFYVLKRRGHVLPWQAADVLALNAMNRGEDSRETEEDIASDTLAEWDTIRIEYLLASLPVDCVGIAIKSMQTICSRYQLKILYVGAEVENLEELGRQLMKNVEYVESKYAKVGSEELAKIIAATYPRK